MKVLIGSIIIAIVLLLCAGCETLPDSPVCEGCSEAEPQTLFGSHDFFLEGEDKVTSSTLATKCQTCGIYFTHPDYGEHIKTCCP